VAVSADSVADALDRLYRDRDHRSDMARRATAFARCEAFQWSSIAARWDWLLRPTLHFPP